MPFYIIALAQKVDGQGRPAAEDAAGYAIRELNAYDDRSVTELRGAYDSDGSIITCRVGPQHSTGRPFEWRGELVVFAPFLVSIEADVKADAKQPSGPVNPMPRPAPQ